MPAHVTSKMISGLSEIVDEFDLFLIDQWGVLHNGETAHEGAVEAMEELRKVDGKTIVILSNSGKRVDDSYDRMEGMGIHKGLYDHVVTSGELCHRNFMAKSDPIFASLGAKTLPFTWNDDNLAILDGTGKEVVKTAEEADFILCTGTNEGDLDYYRPYLRVALEKKLPLICVNPDLVSVAPDGTLNMCPGQVALEYENMGGTVRWHGKPQEETYEYCKSLAPNAKRIVGIGDSLAHDIEGAHIAGGEGLFICGGIHGDELGHPPQQVKIDALTAKRGIVPKYSSYRFVW
ncbi:TIGR01459 family HAD-type hydrolase [Curvivirga sp.]|uniref:TIGR01459 family HAD-type hydrolase n=1 Tax=Curvivirga sp. TaxID=2856848 RepID=UPI003B5C3AEE